MFDLKQKLIEDDPFKDILGQSQTKLQLRSALMMSRHVIIAGTPGIGKTTLAKNVSKLLPEVVVNDCEFNCIPNNPVCPSCITKKGRIKTRRSGGEERFIRVQGSPDLTAEDLIGDIDPIKAMKFGPLSLEAFTPGKIFKANNGILFFDEVNRCHEKLQNTLLQVLEEGKATIGSYNVDIPANFIFIGTMNPEDTSTEKLSDVFLDRFDIVYMSYPENVEIESRIVEAKGKRLVEFPKNMLDLTVLFVRLLRESDKLEKKPSVRASIGLYERAQSNAYIDKRNQVNFDDVKNCVVSVISHRIRLKPSIKYLQSADSFVEDEFNRFLDNNKGMLKKLEQKGDGP